MTAPAAAQSDATHLTRLLLVSSMGGPGAMIVPKLRIDLSGAAAQPQADEPGSMSWRDG